MPSKSVTMNEPPLVGHHLLPSWLLWIQVCTPTQCIGHISVSVPKKWRKMSRYCKKCHNERAIKCHKMSSTSVTSNECEINKDKKYNDHPLAEDQKNLEFASQIQVFPGLRPKGGQNRQNPAQR